jgi:hypothetical protein
MGVTRQGAGRRVERIIGRPHQALRPRRRPRPRIRACGVMEYWSDGVLRFV